MQITIVNQKTKSIRPRSLEASGGSHVGRTATAVAIAPATRPIPSKARMEPLRIRAGAYRNAFPHLGGTRNREEDFSVTGTTRLWSIEEGRRAHGSRSRHLSHRRRRDSRVRGIEDRLGREHSHDRLDPDDRRDRRRRVVDDLLVVLGGSRL